MDVPVKAEDKRIDVVIGSKEFDQYWIQPISYLEWDVEDLHVAPQGMLTHLYCDGCCE